MTTSILRWPNERFYWAILDVSVLPRHLRHSAEHRGFLLEGELPIAIESVQAAYTVLSEDRLLACAVERDVLDAEVDPGVRVLTPESAPDGLIAENAVDLDRLNVLTGAYRPTATRAAHHRFVALACGLVIALVVVATAGLLRRASLLQGAARDAEIATHEALESALGRTLRTDPGSVSIASLELDNRVAAIARTRDASTADRTVFDAAAALSALLGTWPDTVAVEVQQLTLAADRIVCAGTVHDISEPARVTAGFAKLAGWDSRPPELNQQSDDAWSATWNLHRAATTEETP